MYFIEYDSQFQADLKAVAKDWPEVSEELAAVVDVMAETGTVPEWYRPHLLDKAELNYAGYMEFHLLDGKMDVLVVYTGPGAKKTFRLVRIGSHDSLFSGPLL